MYRCQGKLEEAEPRYRETLAIKKKVYGEEHTSVAIGDNNLAELFRVQVRGVFCYVSLYEQVLFEATVFYISNGLALLCIDARASSRKPSLSTGNHWR